MPGSRSKHHRKDSSSSSSSSELECYSNDKECNKHNKHNKHSSDSESSCSSKSSSSSSDKHKFRFSEIYNYFKDKLIHDNELMVAGSTAYALATNTDTQTIPNNHAVHYHNDILKYRIDKYSTNSPFFVRESGVYIFFFVPSTDNSAQFTFFVNGVAKDLTCIGSNSGAGQVVSRHMLALNKDDNVVVRNYISSANSVSTSPNVGGLQQGNDIVILGMKFAPLKAASVDMCKEHKFMECLSHKKKKLFCKIMEKLICDNQLMVKGFNVRGTFYNRVTQNVLTESDVVFNEMSEVDGLFWDPLNPYQVKVMEDGVYKLFFLANTNTAAQFSITVNGIPVDYTTQGTNRGAGQVTIRTLIELNKNDVITVRNHTSANGTVVISEHAGGKYQSITAILTVFKIAPIMKPCVLPINPKLAKRYECYYPLLKDFLLYQKPLQIAGSKSYISLSTSVSQNVNVGQEFSWSNEIIKHDTRYHQGDNYITIQNDGIYDIFADIITNEPLQFTLFVNGLPLDSTVFGRDSGAARTLMRQFVKLRKNDVISVKNWESNAGSVNTAENPGGNFPGQNSMIMAFMLTPTTCSMPPSPPV